MEHVLPDDLRQLLSQQAARFGELQRAADARLVEGMSTAKADIERAQASFLAGISAARVDLEWVNSMLRDARDSAIRAFEAQAAGIRLIAQELEEGQKRLFQAAESLGRSGWTFSEAMPTREILDLAECAGDSSALDERFLRFYAANHGREFRPLASRLVRRNRLRTWRAVLRESLWAYRYGRYRIAIPALLLTIEGLVYELTGSFTSRDTNASLQWHRNAVKPPKGFFVEAHFGAIAAFLGTLWSWHRFDASPSRLLNRHRILHGRYPEVGGRADALRLLAAVDFIAETSDEIEKLVKRRGRKRR